MQKKTAVNQLQIKVQQALAQYYSKACSDNIRRGIAMAKTNRTGRYAPRNI